MDVRKYMTSEVIATTPDLRVLEALDIMKKHKIRRLPVVKGNRLIGLVTYSLISRQLPSQSTSLSMHEVNYLLTKTTVGDIMETFVVTIEPDALLEEAAVVMREKQISVLPVVEHQQLVGIITSSDIFDAFIDVLGYYLPGTRVVVELTHESGQLEKLSALLADKGYNIDQIAVYHENGKAQVVIQIDNKNNEEIRQVLEIAGYTVLSSIEKEGR